MTRTVRRQSPTMILERIRNILLNAAMNDTQKIRSIGLLIEKYDLIVR